MTIDLEYVREAWMHDIGYKLVARDLHMPDYLIKSLYDIYTRNSMDDYLGWLATRKDGR